MIVEFAAISIFVSLLSFSAFFVVLLWGIVEHFLFLVFNFRKLSSIKERGTHSQSLMEILMFIWGNILNIYYEFRYKIGC